VAVTNELAANDVAVGSELLMGTGAKIVAVTTNEDLLLETNGTGTIRINNAQTQSTVGPVGAASKLPLDSANEVRPVGYLKINLAGTTYVIPYFNVS
jgi:TPP-dependent trihydroxycyclohexane-1,2-dione (THcHDO) dehydratase